jgi:hypothetical protein
VMDASKPSRILNARELDGEAWRASRRYTKSESREMMVLVRRLFARVVHVLDRFVLVMTSTTKCQIYPDEAVWRNRLTVYVRCFREQRLTLQEVVARGGLQDHMLVVSWLPMQSWDDCALNDHFTCCDHASQAASNSHVIARTVVPCQ